MNSKLRTFITKKVKRPNGAIVPLPQPGDKLATCTIDNEVKTVDNVNIWGGSIMYEDGSTDSLYYCGWRYASELAPYKLAPPPDIDPWRYEPR